GDNLVAWTMTSDGGLLARVDPRRPQVIRRACGAPAASSPVGFSRDGSRLLASALSGPIVFDVASGQALGLGGAGGYGLALFSADGRWAAATRSVSGPSPGALELYDINHVRSYLLYADSTQ